MKLLLVEDDLVDRRSAQRALRSLQAQLFHAGSIQEAEHLLKEERFDCVVLDWILPDGRADALLGELREHTPQLPVVVVTGVNDHRIAESALQGGAQDYLVKDSLGDNALARAVRHAIERQRALVLQVELAHTGRLAAIGQLAAGIAHEVGNPTTLLMTNLALMHRLSEQLGADPTHQRELATLVAECAVATDRIATLTRQLGDFSRGSLHDPEVLDLAALLRDGIRFAGPSLHQRAEIEIVEAPVAPIVGNRVALLGVLITLLANAQRAIESADPSRPHRIRVTLSSDTDGPLLRVEDSGGGGLFRDPRASFEPFASASEGQGLGLAICREVALHHGGQITVDASDLGGAAFTIALPFDTKLETEGAGKPALPQRLTILLVDDERTLRRALVRLLDEHDVIEAGSGAEAWALLQQGLEPDLVLCDLMMPAQTGAEFYDEVRAAYPALDDRFVFITGGGVTPATQAFLSVVRVSVLRKPFDRRELLSVIRSVLSKTPPAEC